MPFSFRFRGTLGSLCNSKRQSFLGVVLAAVLVSLALVVQRCSSSGELVEIAAPAPSALEQAPIVPEPADVREAVAASAAEPGADPAGVASDATTQRASAPHSESERSLRFEVYYRTGRPIAHANIAITGFVEGRPTQGHSSVDADPQGCATATIPVAWLVNGFLLVQVYDEFSLVFDGLVAGGDPVRVYCHVDPDDPQWIIEGRVEVVGLDDSETWFVQVVRATEAATPSMPLASSAWQGV